MDKHATLPLQHFDDITCDGAIMIRDLYVESAFEFVLSGCRRSWRMMLPGMSSCTSTLKVSQPDMVIQVKSGYICLLIS